MPHDLPIGLALRRFRRLNGIKQGHLAELLAVSQGSVSRWESGTNEPDQFHRDRIGSVIAARADHRGDAALRRLVVTSSLPVHLVCDATHTLLAASPSRTASWLGGGEIYLGTTLWPFASAEIVAAEEGLAAAGWFERPFQALSFETGDNESAEVPVRRSLMRWETIPLADGRIGRLTTTIGRRE